MLDNCIEIFKKKDMLRMVLDNYVPSDGEYVVMEYKEGTFQVNMHVKVKQNKKTRELGISHTEQMEIAKMDYWCRLLDMNKPVDPKKVIHSNNYLSFWIKKESLTNGKLTGEIIDKYYDILSEPKLKYTKKKSLELYLETEKSLGELNKEALELVRRWIKENIFGLPFPVEGKDYLKIFFLVPETSFEVEGQRYQLPNIYNTNDYNCSDDEGIVGVPNNNMQMNSKKPYLEHKNQLKKVPFLQASQKVKDKKLFFDYLLCCASNGQYNVYFYTEKEDDGEFQILPLKNQDLPKIKDGFGYYLRIHKGKSEAVIDQMDRFTSYRSTLDFPITIENVTEVPTEKMKVNIYTQYGTLSAISEVINSIYFSKYLSTNYFTEASDMTGIVGRKKQLLLKARGAFFDWFYKGNDCAVRSLWENLSLQILCDSIQNGNIMAVNHQYNVWMAVRAYFKGGEEHMADVMRELRQTIREKINSKEYSSIQSDEEYYYGVGQIVNFLISKNKSKKKPHSFFNAFLNIQKDAVLKDKIEVLFKKYNYDIEANSLRFNQLFNMVVSYQPQEKVLKDYMLAGYISNNLIYEKGDK